MLLRTVIPCGKGIINHGAHVFKTCSLERARTANFQMLIEGGGTSMLQRRWCLMKAEPKELAPTEQRIYYGSLAPRMKAVKVFSLTTSFAGLAAQPILMEQGLKIGGAGMAVLLCSVAGFFTFVTPLLLHFITKKYVTEIHYNAATDEYTATTISLILRKIQTKFKVNDVKVPEVPGMFTSFIVAKKALFVDPVLFENPEHYIRIMGYDKPIDYKLELKGAVPKLEGSKEEAEPPKIN